MRPFQARVAYEATPEAVARMLADHSFVERKVAASGPVSSEVHVAGSAAAGFVVTTRRALPTDRLPAVAQRLVGPSVEIAMVETWGPAAADGSREGELTLDVVGKPAAARGTIRLAPGQPGETVLTYEGTVEAKVPLVGGALEAQAADQVQRVVNAEHRVGETWLAGR